LTVSAAFTTYKEVTVPANSTTRNESKKDETTKATPPTDAEKKKGILVRRKVRATGHVIERIDGKLNDLGEDGGRWIVRVTDTGKVHRFASYSEMVKAGRKL
jgi:hypothetical protein